MRENKRDQRDSDKDRVKQKLRLTLREVGMGLGWHHGWELRQEGRVGVSFMSVCLFLLYLMLSCHLWDKWVVSTES